MTTDVYGTVEPGFEGVREAFAANFERRGDVGAAAAVTLDGKFVVDLYGGIAGPGEKPWQHDTIVNVYSSTKTMAATCVLVLMDRGLVDPDAPVAQYWPEFAANGKDGVLVRHVMSHSAGIPGFEPPLASTAELYDWHAITRGLAAQAPMWEPGTASGYHAVTQGYLQGEIVRRVTGRSIGMFFREEIAEPLGADFHIGLPPGHDDRVAELIPPDSLPQDLAPDPDSIGAHTLASVPLTGLEPRTEAWRRAEIPAAGGIGNARALARVLSALACGGIVDGVRLMSKATVESIIQEQTNGTDLVLATPIRFGMGFGLNSPDTPMSPSERMFFWGGWGGSLCIVDLDQRLSIAYVMNKMEVSTLGDPRGAAILGSVYSSLQG
jgi:CubicO group peptidase (beta-lactamase class C family)